MADKPIIFSGPMVRALLAGWKTQTRRVLTPHCDDAPAFVHQGVITALDERECSYRWPHTKAVGDRLWVREACHIDGRQVNYRADAPDGSNPPGPWRPSIHMPRWASRLTLTVTDVRVQRLQDISRGDAMGEGCPFANMQDGPNPRGWFSNLWNSLHGPEAWDANPWVAAYSFTVQRGNIDNG